MVGQLKAIEVITIIIYCFAGANACLVVPSCFKHLGNSPMSTSDAILRDQLQILYLDNHRWLYRWLCKKVGCTYNAEDVTQNTFLRLFSLTNLDAIREPRAFLTTTASRLLIDEARRKKVEQQYLATYMDCYGEDARVPAAEELVIISETLAAIVQMLEGLPEKCQRAFLMSRLEGMKHGQIAQLLGVSTSMIKQYMAKAMLHCYQLTYDA